MANMSTSIRGCVKDKPTPLFKLNLPSARSIVTLEDVKLLKSLDIKSARSQLATILQLDRYEIDMKNAILADYYFSGYWWAKSNLIQPAKIVPFMELLVMLLKNMTDLRLNEEENLKVLKKTMMSSIETSERVLSTFSMKEAQGITEFLMTGLFQHYKLYECCFRRKRPRALIMQELDVETIKPNILQSLGDAMDEEAVQLAQAELEQKNPSVYVGSYKQLNIGKTYMFSELHG